jgi:MFS family permease
LCQYKFCYIRKKKQRKIGISTINKAFQFRKRQRIALSAFFFLSGFCFSSWASRIPTIKANLDINEAELGTLLLVMPLSQFAGLPLSGWLVSKFDSRGPLAVAFLVHLVLLVMIAHAKSIFIMAAVLFAFAFFSRIFNIAMNTQSVVLSKAYSKPINGSFHALWSLGGIAGAIITTIMIALKINMSQQFMVVALLSATLTTLIYKSLISNDRSPARNKILLGKPDLQILLLGAIIILAAICEGGMFDWSSVYFREVIGVEIFTTGYLTFMICMALSRFLTDGVMARVGMKKTYQLSVFFDDFRHVAGSAIPPLLDDNYRFFAFWLWHSSYISNDIPFGWQLRKVRSRYGDFIDCNLCIIGHTHRPRCDWLPCVFVRFAHCFSLYCSLRCRHSTTDFLLFYEVPKPQLMPNGIEANNALIDAIFVEAPLALFHENLLLSNVIIIHAVS